MSNTTSNKRDSKGRRKVYTRKGKVTLHVLIEKDLYDKLIQIAPIVYGSSKGALSYVVEEALRYWLGPRLHTQMHTNPSRSIATVYNTVIEKVKEILKIDIKPYEVPEKILDAAIAQVRGSDPRTISKWKDTFIGAGLIKVLGGREPKRIFELI